MTITTLIACGIAVCAAYAALAAICIAGVRDAPPLKSDDWGN